MYGDADPFDSVFAVDLTPSPPSHENIFKYYGNLFASVSLFQHCHGKSTMEFHGLRTLKLLLRHWN